jgi:hypothetical protein
MNNIDLRETQSLLKSTGIPLPPFVSIENGKITYNGTKSIDETVLKFILDEWASLSKSNGPFCILRDGSSKETTFSIEDKSILE